LSDPTKWDITKTNTNADPVLPNNLILDGDGTYPERFSSLDGPVPIQVGSRITSYVGGDHAGMYVAKQNQFVWTRNQYMRAFLALRAVCHCQSVLILAVTHIGALPQYHQKSSRECCPFEGGRIEQPIGDFFPSFFEGHDKSSDPKQIRCRTCCIHGTASLILNYLLFLR
jgi:hypothetical protein